MTFVEVGEGKRRRNGGCFYSRERERENLVATCFVQGTNDVFYTMHSVGTLGSFAGLREDLSAHLSPTRFANILLIEARFCFSRREEVDGALK